MRADHLSYKRAASFSLLGMALQLALGLALLIYSALSADLAARTASFYILSGVIVWLVLAVVFDQHRRERLEALEAQSLAGISARQTTVFEENPDDLRIAAKRLAWMHKILVPGTSLALAALLIGLGVWRFLETQSQTVKYTAVDERFRPWIIAMGLTIAVAGFLFARFISGMAKQPVWANLRAGATQAVGAALMGLALAVGQFVDIAGPDVMLAYLGVVFAGMMVVLGAEIILNFVLGIYRPRRPGEVPRPAFDSRILGFVAAPDKIAESIGEAINYQFGFEVTSSWFYQLLSRSLVALILVGAAVVWLMSMVAVVGPDERGLRVRNGVLVNEGSAALPPGPYLKLPWPFERIETFKALQARRIDLASPAPAADKAILWTNEHVDKEQDFYLFCRPPRDGAVAGSASGAASASDAEVRDLALVSIEVPVYYTVEDVEKYEKNLGPPETREARLRAAGQQVLMRYIATRRLDDLLGPGRAGASAEIGRLVQDRFTLLDCGVKVLYAGIEGVHPPTATAATFEQVVATQQSKQTIITTALSERIGKLSKAAGSVAIAEEFLDGRAELRALEESLRAMPEGDPGRAELAHRIAEKETALERLLLEGQGQAAAILRAAKAERWATHMGERARAESYAGELQAYRASPRLYSAQLYLRTLRDVMEKSRVYIVTDDLPVEIRVNNEEPESTGNPLTAPPQE